MPKYPPGVRFVDKYGQPAKLLLVKRETEEDRRAFAEQMRQLNAERRTEAYRQAEKRLRDHQLKFQDFEVANHLDNPEAIAAYFTEAFKVDDIQHIAFALIDIARAKGMTEIVDRIWAGLNEFQPTMPSIATAREVLDSIGLKMAVTPAKASS